MEARRSGWFLPRGTVAPRPIVVSDAIADKWLVESGLQPGERVVVEGLQKIRPGASVKAVSVEAAAGVPPIAR